MDTTTTSFLIRPVLTLITQKKYLLRSGEQWLYLLEGCALVILNGLLLVAILWRKSLQRKKEYGIIAISLLVEAIYGGGYFLAGLDRLLTLDDEVSTTTSMTPWSCYVKAYNIVLLYSTPMICLSIVMLTMDRLFATCDLPRYDSFTTTKYVAFWMLTLFFLPIPLMGFTIWSTEQRSQASLQISSFCYTIDIIGDFGYGIFNGFCLIAAAVGVVLYISVVILNYKMKPDTVDKDAATIDRQDHSKRITWTIAMIMLSNLLLLVIPSFLRMINPNDVGQRSSLVWFLMTTNKGVVNVCIYAIRHTENFCAHRPSSEPELLTGTGSNAGRIAIGDVALSVKSGV